jgi:3-oxoacyl-[acyl-carrier-protein] synthase III
LKPIHFNIDASAVYLPERVVLSSEVDRLAKLADGSVASTYKIFQRRWANSEETSSYMAAQASLDALKQANWQPESLDVIIGACGVMEQPIPGTAALVQRRIGLGTSGIPAFDINATCLSFLQALDRVLLGFALGEWHRALVFTADIASAALDFSSPEASAIFGDGATALLLSADGPHARIAHRFNTFGQAADVCQLEAGGTRLRPFEDLENFLARSKFKMDGRGVFLATALRFPPFMTAVMDSAAICAEQLAVIVPHQASASALEHLKRSVPDGHEKAVDIFSLFGNQIATSMPHALHVARNRGRLEPGKLGLLVGSSAGISLGASVFRW